MGTFLTVPYEPFDKTQKSSYGENFDGLRRGDILSVCKLDDRPFETVGNFEAQPSLCNRPAVNRSLLTGVNFGTFGDMVRSNMGVCLHWQVILPAVAFSLVLHFSTYSQISTGHSAMIPFDQRTILSCHPAYRRCKDIHWLLTFAD